MELKLTQRELSDKMGYSNHSTITRIEAGKVDIPQSRIVQFAEVLGVSVAHLMGWDNDIIENPVETAGLHARILTDSELMEMIAEYYELSASNKKMVRDLVHNLKKND